MNLQERKSRAEKKGEQQLWLNDARGVYIPRDFAKSFVDRDKNVSGVTAEEWTRLEAGPDEAWYWEVWDNVLDNAIVTDNDGVKYRLYQEGDLWLIPEGMEWSDEKEGYVWPDEEESDDVS